jgi:hypothetical protein
MRPLKDVELPPEVFRLRKISVKQAAELKNLSEDTFRRRYGHLIEKVSESLSENIMRDCIVFAA